MLVVEDNSGSPGEFAVGIFTRDVCCGVFFITFLGVEICRYELIMIYKALPWSYFCFRVLRCF